METEDDTVPVRQAIRLFSIGGHFGRFTDVELPGLFLRRFQSQDVGIAHLEQPDFVRSLVYMRLADTAYSGLTRVQSNRVLHEFDDILGVWVVEVDFVVVRDGMETGEFWRQTSRVGIGRVRLGDIEVERDLRINAASTGSCFVRIAQELAFFLFPDVADGSEHIRYRDPRSEVVEQVFRKPDATHHLTIDGVGDSLVKEPEVEDFALPGEFGLILGLQAIGSGDVEGFLLY